METRPAPEAYAATRLTERHDRAAFIGRRRLGYLVSQYPTFTHTFVLREVLALRDLGVAVEVLSIRAPDRPVGQLPPVEASEAHMAEYVIQGGFWRALAAHLRCLGRRPLRYASALVSAAKLGLKNPARLPSHCAYFAESGVVADWLGRRKLTRLHVHFSSTVALMAVAIEPVELSLTIHGPAEFDDVEGFHMREKAMASSRVVVISQFARSQVLRAIDPDHWSKVVVVPLGVDTDAYSPSPRVQDSPPFKILTVGRLAPVKGHEVLLEAIARLREQGRDLQCSVVGDGPLRGRLEARAAGLGIRDTVHFRGALPQEEVWELYGEADLFALSSFAEGVPVVLMEAMARGLPCVAPNIMGIPELVRHGTDGILVSPADVVALADAIASMQDNPAIRARMAASAAVRVAECYNLRNNSERLSRVLGFDPASTVGTHHAISTDPSPQQAEDL